MIGSLAFTSPLILIALAALPAIWLLLRITPPRPEREVFPPFRILLGLRKREETPATTPWWLMLLRLVLAAALIVALAGPLLNPNAASVGLGGPLAIVFDNSWASAPTFEKRRATAEMLVREASENDLPVSLVFTSDEAYDATLKRADEQLKVLAAAKPIPLPADRRSVIAALDAAFAEQKPAMIALFSDGIATEGDTMLFDGLKRLAGLVTLYGAENPDAMTITGAINASDRLTISLTRLETRAPQSVVVSARDMQGRILGSTKVDFVAGKMDADGIIDAPFELRNDFAKLTIDGYNTAGAVRLLDDSFKRRSVGLISGESADRSQPLLSPLYYISRALSPFANLSEPQTADLATSIPAMTKAEPAIIVLADIGRMPASAETALTAWIERGGTLVRFAGPRLAAAPADDPLIPVRLRQGERALGGSMSWAKPQPLDAYPEASPFAGLRKPDGVLVSRQVLAEPTSDLQNLTWASLADGTPLVTARRIGAGRIVLFHVSAESSWSNLPLSGDFVEMLRRIVQLSHSAAGAATQDGKTLLAPYRLLTANGQLTTEKGLAKPIEAGAKINLSHAHPPGLYGSDDGFQALNLFDETTRLRAIAPPADLNFTRAGFAGDDSLSLKPWLLTLAVGLALLDSLIMLFLGGALRVASEREWYRAPQPCWR